MTDHAAISTIMGSPTKKFFVEMLTRDIDLYDAILDLLDNCVDGILRSKAPRSVPEPYKGFFAKISFNDSSFTIQDNCGGIPWKLRDYAFRMGRSADYPEIITGGIGNYGIGMKRAIFKIGRRASISTYSAEDSYCVDIMPSWLDDPDEWNLPIKRISAASANNGTCIEISTLNDDIASLLSHDKDSFIVELRNRVKSHYSIIIDKGFEVFVSGTRVTPAPIRLISHELPQQHSIRPYMYIASAYGVDVFLAVGFAGRIPTPDEGASDISAKSYYKSDLAGWTIVCNDRTVLYCDKSALTGWGEAGVPKYHTQFIAISGMVEFSSKDSALLPTTTTKRGLNTSSELYLQVKNKMREGMKMFTNYTNKWKSDPDNPLRNASNYSRYTLSELRQNARSMEFKSVIRDPGGKQYKPNLPLPQKEESLYRTISFKKHNDDIEVVSRSLFGSSSRSPNRVGEKCFDVILEDAKK